MATPGNAVPARRHRLARRAAVGLAASIGMALGAVLAPPPAAAEEPATAAEAGELMAARGHDLEVVTEDFNEARERLTALQETAGAAAAAAEQAQAGVLAAQEQVRGVARSAWTGDSGGALRALLTSASADEFVDQLTVLGMVADHHSGVLVEAVSAGDAAAAARATADQAAAEAQQTYDAVAARQAALEAEIARYQADFARLSAEEQRATLAAAAAAHGEGHRASREEREESAPAELAAPAAPVVADGAAAQIAVDTAMAQRGLPYVWAAAGPRSFDCSGLTQFAFRAAGLDLPHSSRMQSQMGQPVSRNALRPGDLVFFYSPVSHVGIYIGNGQMVHAPTSGDVVKVASIDTMGDYAGARRLAAG